MKKYGRLILVVLMVFSLVFTAAGCNKTQTGDKTKKEAQVGEKTKEKVLKVGSETAYPPFETQAKNGEYVGFDMDLIRAIGEAEGYKVEIVSLPFTGLIPALKAGNIDAAISAMTITDERKKSVDFSDPYIDSGQIIAIRSDDKRPISKPEDLKGLKVSVQMGTTGQFEVEKIQKLDPKTEIKKFDSVDQAFAELANKGVDAAVVDLPVTANYIATGHPELKMVGKTFTSEKYGISVNKGNTEVYKVINDGLKKVKASGKYDEIYGKYFAK
ncbi:MAG: basic amino acid ABC transporter substrate-binding protein [Chitinophagales bacterium]